jgi:serine/threonine-protein kinase
MSRATDDQIPPQSATHSTHGADGLAAPGGPAGSASGAALAERYRLDTRLGAGLLTTTYRALDLTTERLVAVKIFAPQIGADPMFRARFLEKARVAMELVHPNVAAVYDAGIAGNRAYLAMELLEGQSLRTLLSLRGRLPLHTALHLAVQIADALVYAHGRGLFHADLRPENVLFDRQGHPKVIDFGMCHVAVATGIVALETLARRAPYLAPEQLRGESLGPRTDVYALAVILYELLVGTPPGGDRDPLAAAARRATEEPPHLRRERPDVSPPLERVIREALAPDPADRFPSAEAFRAALVSPPRDGRRRSEAPSGDLAPPLPPTRRPVRKGWWSQALAVGLPLLATLLVVVTLTGLLDFLPPLLVPLQAVQVPDVRNRAFAEAELVARGSGLEAVKARPEPCDQYARDFVIRQEPDPGAIARRGGKVRLTTCSGIRVPNLVGQREEQVRVQLVQRGWTVSEVRQRPGSDAAPGTVVAQEPAAGLILADKQPLILTVSQAPR